MDQKDSRDTCYLEMESPPTYQQIQENPALLGAHANPPPPPPPVYQSPPPSAPPPTYESLYVKVKDVAEQDIYKTYISKPMSSVGCSMLFGLFIAVPISMIFMGAKHLDDCDAERMIPIYLIVAGSFTLPRNIGSVIKRCCCKSEEELEDENDEGDCKLAIFFYDFFLFAWFITGCVYIFRTKDEFQSADRTIHDYCDYTLYWYSFWITIFYYFLAGAGCCYFCCVAFASGCCESDNDESE